MQPQWYNQSSTCLRFFFSSTSCKPENIPARKSRNWKKFEAKLSTKFVFTSVFVLRLDKWSFKISPFSYKWMIKANTSLVKTSLAKKLGHLFLSPLNSLPHLLKVSLNNSYLLFVFSPILIPKETSQCRISYLLSSPVNLQLRAFEL